MDTLPGSITISVLLLTIFLVFITALKYAIEDNFLRTRLIMTAFFIFIVATLTVCYWPFFFATLPFTIPAGLVGVIIGYFVAVRAAEEKLKEEGVAYYMSHFAHIHFKDVTVLNWWSLVNFYSIMGALALLNLVGLTTVLFHNLKPLTLLTSAFGAFLIGTIAPYLVHLWSIKSRKQKSNRTISEA
jgi:hypothetical protein